MKIFNFKNINLNKNIKMIIPYVLIFFISCTYLLTQYENLDEMWNYNFVKNYVMGELPYKDYNMLQTPLFILFPVILMKIFGCQLIIFRIVGVLIQFFIFSLMYFLISKITKIRLFSIFLTIVLQAYDTLFYIYNYNYLNLLIVMIIFICFENKEKYPNQLRICIPLLVGITPLVKQSTGALLIAAYVVILILEHFIKKEKIFIIVKQIIVMCIPMLIFIIWLSLKGILIDWWDYCIYGVTTFTNKYTLYQAITTFPFVSFSLILIIIVIVYYIVRVVKGNSSMVEFDYFIISIAHFSVAYPLCDSYHYYISILPFIVFTFKVIKLSECKKYVKIILKSAIFIVLVLLTIYSVVPLEKCYMTNFDNLKYIPINKNTITQIQCVDDYIIQNSKKGVPVYIADSASVALTIPLNIYRKNWDMLLIGNLGKTTYKEILNVENNALILTRDNKENYSLQECIGLINYVEKNYKKVDKVGVFNVYKKN